MQLPVDWVTVTIWPATIMVPVRGLPVPFAATLKLNDPSPDMPLLVMVIQATVLAGVHAQLDPVTIEMLLLSPADDADMAVGDTLYVHCASAARTSSPHHEAKSSANVTLARRSVMRTSVQTRTDAAPTCIPRAVGAWPQVVECERFNRNGVEMSLSEL